MYPRVVELTGKVFSDQKCRFPVIYSRGMKYIFVLYYYYSSSVLAEPIKSWSATNILSVYTKLHYILKSRGLKPLLAILDNECSTALKEFFHKNTLAFKLVTLHDHCRNTAERAIGIFKVHFISGLKSLYPTFPMHLRFRLFPQAIQKINLLHASRINPWLSYNAQINREFDFSKTPLAPPSTKVLIHERPVQRKTWAPHGIKGFYVGGVPYHYWCYKVYATKSRYERIALSIKKSLLRKDACPLLCRCRRLIHYRPLLRPL